MKKWIVVSVVCLTGCVTAKYNSATGDLSYSRLGDQKVSGVSIMKDANGLSVTIENQQSEAKILNDAMQMMMKAYEMGTKTR